MFQRFSTFVWRGQSIVDVHNQQQFNLLAEDMCVCKSLDAISLRRLVVKETLGCFFMLLRNLLLPWNNGLINAIHAKVM